VKRLPAWVLLMVGLPLLCLGAAIVMSFLPVGSAPGVVAGLVPLALGAWILLEIVRDERTDQPGSASFEVSGPALIGGEVQVTLRLLLPKRLALNPNRQTVRFFIEERLPDRNGDFPADSHVLHEEKLPLSVPLDTVGDWSTSWTLKIPASAPPTMIGARFLVHAQLELLLPHGSFGEIKANAPVEILPEVAGE
jgi:hypothetical protein